MSARAILLAAAAALLPLSGCASHERLVAGDREVSEEEVVSAGESDDERLTAPLHRILERRADHPPGVVVATLVALGKRKDRRSVPAVLALARDEDEEVRWHVARTLRELGGAEAEAELARMARDDPSELVREAAAPRG